VANSLQAKKRARQAEVHRQRNAGQRSAMRTSVKMVATAIESADYETAQAAFVKAVPSIDSAANKGLIHKNKAARTKSRLNTRIKELK
jgi:small subunit ribosomal protein S20